MTAVVAAKTLGNFGQATKVDLTAGIRLDMNLAEISQSVGYRCQTREAQHAAGARNLPGADLIVGGIGMIVGRGGGQRQVGAVATEKLAPSMFVALANVTTRPARPRLPWCAPDFSRC